MTRLICDDKGVRFLVGFGMPGRAFEDDESRAVVSSLELLQQLPTLPNHNASGGLAPCIGITTGTVFCGEAGSSERREYTLAGARVNLAARLMSYAVKHHKKALAHEAQQIAAQVGFFLSAEAAGTFGESTFVVRGQGAGDAFHGAHHHARRHAAEADSRCLRHKLLLDARE